jgi:hypothetical protein
MPSDHCVIFFVCQDDERGSGVPYNSLVPEPPEPTQNSRTLGTFNGVFAPVSLSMLSSILFLRIGYILGNYYYYYHNYNDLKHNVINR